MRANKVLIIGIIALGEGTTARADFAVSAWTLSSSVRDFTGGPGHNDLQVSTTVQNPFNQSLNAAYSSSLAQAAHNFNWSMAAGQFNTAVHLEAQGGPNFASTSDNLFRITTTSDVLLHAVGQWTYHIGGGFRQMEYTMLVGTVPNSNFFFADGLFATPALGDPATGTYNGGLDVLLPAGGTYFFRSIFSFTASSGSPKDLSIGTGFTNFSLTSVPCPAALGPLAFAALLFRKRRGRKPA